MPPNPQTAESDPYQDLKAIQHFAAHARKEAFRDHWTFERQWQRVISYVLNRQWIWWDKNTRHWREKKLAKWIPKPVTNIMRTALVSIRAMFASAELAALIRPNGNEPENVQAAAVADEQLPLIHEEHRMDQQFSIGDYWMLTCGCVFLHPWWDRSVVHGTIFIEEQRCLQCGEDALPDEIEDAGDTCPHCGGQQFGPAIDQHGQPQGVEIPKGRGTTDVVSPFEVGGPPNYNSFEEWPYLVRKRWRDKSYYEAHFPHLVPNITFQRAPLDLGLQIFRSLAQTSDFDMSASGSVPSATGAHGDSEGVEEYEVWVKPSAEYPKGLVARLVGDGEQAILIQDPSQGLPGPIPFVDIEGTPLWPWVKYGFEAYGGRVWDSGALDVLISPQDQINQIDSNIQLSIQRMANPVWLEPKGAEVEKFTGEPGLVVKWNPLGPGGLGEPKRLEGVSPPGALFTLRDQKMADAEELVGTFDVVKGDRPLGVEAFSAIQALIERSQARFKTPLKNRSRAYRDWVKLAIELERQFGPEERVKSVLGPNRSWTFQAFQNAQLQGAISVVVEDGSNMPKTTLGLRAAIDQANGLGLLNVADPDERMSLMGHFGLLDMIPGLDQDVKSAQQEQDAFEKWVQGALSGSTQTPNPLRVEAWHNHTVHAQENRKWMNSDKVREMLVQIPQEQAEGVRTLLSMHLQEHQAYLQPQLDPAATGTAGTDLANSNQESGAVDSLPSGNGPQTGAA